MVMPKFKENEICFQQFITDYFETREQLVCAFVLIDIRHEAQAIDIEFMSYMEKVKFVLHHLYQHKISKVKLTHTLPLQKEYVCK
jgi:GTP-binding protein